MDETVPRSSHASSGESTSSARLRDQHEYIKSGLGFLLHPSIHTHLIKAESKHSRVRIAEIACGSGVWLVDVARRLASEIQVPITLDGFDSTDVQVPRHDVPPHVRFHLQDFISVKGVPAEFVGQFNVVVVRLLHVSLNDDQWDNVMKNILLLLEPGGYIQWVDFDPLTARIAAFRPQASDAVLRDVFHRFTDTLRARKVGSTYRIPNTMVANGLEVIDSDMYPLSPKVEFTQILGKEAVAILQESGNVTIEGGETMRRELMEEVEAGGSLVWYDLWCHIGRKVEEE